MAETLADKIRRLRRERNRKRKLRSNILNRAEQYARRIRKINAALNRLTKPDVPGEIDGWHEKAIRTQVHGGIGSYSTGVKPKGVVHTTEGSGLPKYSGSHPHFTYDVKRRLLYQHIPVTSGAMALENDPGGVETNRAHAIQIELIGWSDLQAAIRAGKPQYAVANWTAADYEALAPLFRWVEKHCGVKRACTVKFEDRWHGLAAAQWLAYEGWLGHQHVPENIHWDPSGSFRIKALV